MAYGLEIRNTNNIIQIDDTNPGLGLVQSGELYTNSYSIGKLWVRSVVVNNATDPIIALRGDGPLAISGRVVSGSTVTFYVLGAQNTRFNYWIFDKYPANTGNYGLEVYDSAGNRTFASDYPPLRVVDFTNFTQTLPSGRVHAIIQEKPAYYNFSFGFNPPYTINEYYQGTYVYDSDTSAISTLMLNGQFTSSEQQFDGTANPKMLIVDVTGIGTQPPLTPTYTVIPGSSDVNEGSSITFNVDTTYVTNGTTLYYTLTGSTVAADFTDSSLSGSFTITSNTGSFTKTLTNDVVTEGSEFFHAEVRTGSTSGTIVATSTEVLVNDTSVSPYTISESTSTVNEGSSVTFSITTPPLVNGTLVYYTITGTVSSADFTDSTMSGSASVNNNTASVVKTLVNDLSTEGSETFEMQLRTGSTSGPIQDSSATITVNDTSTAPTANITVDGATIFDSAGNNQSNYTLVSFNTDGDAEYTITTGAITNQTDWTDNTSVNSSYEIRLTVTSGASPTSGSATNTWLNLSSSRNWSLITPDPDPSFSFGARNSASWLIEIRDVATQTVQDSGTYTISQTGA